MGRCCALHRRGLPFSAPLLLLPLLLAFHAAQAGLAAESAEEIVANLEWEEAEGTVETPAPITCNVLQQDGETKEALQVRCGTRVLVVPSLVLRKYLAHSHCELEAQLPLGTGAWWIHGIYALICVMGAAMAAGLTLGLTSIDEFGLKVLCNRLVEEVSPRESPEVRLKWQSKLIRDQLCAKTILPVISGRYFRTNCCWFMPQSLNPTNRHYLLVTLLLANAAANEALPIFLGRMVPEWLAVIFSVTVVLIFGEIVPSAIFTGPNQLALAARLSPLVRLVKFTFMPVVWPISLALDKCLGQVHEVHCRAEIKALIRTLKMECLELDEVNMLHGVLEMHQKRAVDIAAPLEEARMLPHDTIINQDCVKQLLSWGHSRVFLYRRDEQNPLARDDIVGVVLVKKLLGINLEENRRIDSVMQALKQPVLLSPEDNLLSTLNKFQDGMCHLALISNHPDVASRHMRNGEKISPAARPFMFCSLEDVIEEMLKEDILDEEDAELQCVWRPPTTSSVAVSVQDSDGHRLATGDGVVIGTTRQVRAQSFGRSIFADTTPDLAVGKHL